ncbi:DUF2142 domain-containing protein [Planosporangium flavigriseum]|uniref:DUF2142 domain-containing protein n=1 Tax=Planosporangium flavigriseum TaxID=373681 RepID=A0A8J3LWB2_9ACTN|nr:DUF2142 domain-containing protein [Planosporangium flavigriseum]NJC65590.1 DUF2142 domain-containing protein [Planosporangium flavigriseum]GIG74751.1 hypothetical protein Pfl04_31550 [Planosporangium flavigriseum]
MSHALRACQVASGDIMPELAPRGAYQSVPKNLRSEHCPLEPRACQADLHGPQTPIRFANSAGRYNPFYYAMVGAPLKIWPTMKGVVLARLISAARAAALLAAALVSVVSYSRYRFMLGALLFGATPIAINMAGAINPSGLEIAAGIAFFASAIPLLVGSAREHPPTWLVCVTVVSAVILVMVRSGGPIWLALGGLALLLPLTPRTVRQVLRPVAVRWGVLVLVVAGIASALWILIMKPGEIVGVSPFALLNRGQLFIGELMTWPSLTQQLVGITGWLDTAMWPPAYQFWQYPAAALLLVALLVGSGLDRVRLLVVVGGTIAAAAILDMSAVNKVGFWFAQGRYLLPTLSGALLLAAWIIERRGAITAAYARLSSRLAVVVTLPIQLHALQVTMARYQQGIPRSSPPPNLSSYNPLVGSWHPQVGSLLPLLCSVSGLVLLGVLCWRLAAGSARPSVTDHAEGVPGEGSDSSGRENLSGQPKLSAFGTAPAQ